MNTLRQIRVSRFQAEVVSGHKGAAVEVPFDPSVKWGSTPQQIRPGRRGHLAHGTLNGTKFDSAIVSRSRRFWLLLDDRVLVAAAAQLGEVVNVTVAPFK
jgi:hypothetical protein